MASCKLLAFDLGAGSGRAMLGGFDGERLALSEIHRFPHSFSMLGGRAYWDILLLMEGVKQGLAKAGKGLAGAGVDTWGVDFALLDAQGQLLAMPRSYRDPAYTDANMTEALEALGGEEWLFGQTGIASINYNTIFKLYHMAKTDEAPLAAAHKLLMMPALIEYYLTGVIHAEYTSASTTQLYDMQNRCWAKPVLQKLGLAEELFPLVDLPGRKLGPLESRLAAETGQQGLPVISVAGHDTACAAGAVAAKGPEYAFLSSGTWSLMGFVSRRFNGSAALAKARISNEGAFDGGYRFTASISGMWILQQCKNQWEKAGTAYSFDELMALAQAEKPLCSFIRPEDFEKPGNYPAAIARYCAATGQPVPQSPGAVVRCVMDSLALKYRQVFETLSALFGRPDCLHLVGGGVRNGPLNQCIANALGLPVVTGAAEATAAGNLLMQLEALGEIAGQSQRQQVLANSFETQTWLPANTGHWAEAYQAYLRLCKQGIE